MVGFGNRLLGTFRFYGWGKLDKSLVRFSRVSGNIPSNKVVR